MAGAVHIEIVKQRSVRRVTFGLSLPSLLAYWHSRDFSTGRSLALLNAVVTSEAAQGWKKQQQPPLGRVSGVIADAISFAQRLVSLVAARQR